MANAKGTALVQAVKALRAIPGAADHLPPHLRHYLSERILISSWYPEEDYLGLFTALVALFPRGRGASIPIREARDSPVPARGRESPVPARGRDSQSPPRDAREARDSQAPARDSQPGRDSQAPARDSQPSRDSQAPGSQAPSKDGRDSQGPVSVDLWDLFGKQAAQHDLTTVYKGQARTATSLLGAPKAVKELFHLYHDTGRIVITGDATHAQMDLFDYENISASHCRFITSYGREHLRLSLSREVTVRETQCRALGHDRCRREFEI